MIAWCQVTNPRTLPEEWEQYGIGDPYILKFRGKYYLYCSTRDDQHGVKCWSSWDLHNWNYEGLCVSNTVTQSKGAYAPEVIYWNGTFYMYTSPAGQGHYILSSSSPTGPFTVQTGNVGRTIDGSVFTDDNGAHYFTYAGDPAIQGATMSSPLAIDGPAVNTGASLKGWTEGSTVFKRNGLYYIIYTGNHVFSKGYRIHYGTSTSPLGPYTAGQNNPVILNTEGSFFGLGHSGSVIGPDLDTWYIAYHNLIGQSPIVGPVRKLNIDPTAFNGEKLVVLGPTNWPQESPSLPHFFDRFNRVAIGTGWTNVGGGNWGIYNQELMWQDNKLTAQWYRQVTTASTASDYTAEFNMKEMSRGANGARFGAVFSYTNENNFASAVFSSFNNTLETDVKVNGVSAGVQVVAMPPGWDYQKWHVLRVEKSGNTFKVYVDGMLKSTRTGSGVNGGKIGVATFNDHADFGYTAFSNHVNGSAIFNFYKPVPGVIQAVHFNAGGEGAGYHDTSTGNTGGQYRAEHVDIRNCPEGGHNIGWNTAGEWYRYNVNVKSPGPYHLGLRYSTTFAGCKVRIWCDNTAVSGVVNLPSTGGWNNWQTVSIQNLDLPGGNHTIRVETVEGEFDFYTLQFNTGTTAAAQASDNFDAGFSSGWNYTNGSWSTSGGRAVLPDFGKRLMGHVGWSDYVVEADIRCAGSGNSGLIFRVQNPANGGANNNSQLGTDFLQGYFAGISTNGLVLGKHNYNWKQLAFKNEALVANQWYKMRVVVQGSSINVYLDNRTTPEISYTDTDPFISGKAGLRAHAAQAEFDNFIVASSVAGAMSAAAGQSGGEALRAAPNPFTTESVLYFNGEADQEVTVTVLDAKGVKMRHYTDTLKAGKLAVGSGLPPGYYTVTIVQGKNVRTFKIIKQ